MPLDLAGLKSLELSKEDRKEDICAPCDPKEDDGPRYPWGTRISLSNPELEKLGADAALDVGMEVLIVARAKVTSFNANEYVDDGEKKIRRSVDLQITDMALNPQSKPTPAPDVLYGPEKT
jgi:hypothetical protein